MSHVLFWVNISEWLLCAYVLGPVLGTVDTEKIQHIPVHEEISLVGGRGT